MDREALRGSRRSTRTPRAVGPVAFWVAFDLRDVGYHGSGAGARALSDAPRRINERHGVSFTAACRVTMWFRSEKSDGRAREMAPRSAERRPGTRAPR